MKVRYTIIIEESEDIKNWDSSTDEEAIEKIRDYVKDDPEYLVDSAWKEIKVEVIPNVEIKKL